MIFLVAEDGVGVEGVGWRAEEKSLSKGEYVFLYSLNVFLHF